jgi:hypothetical protein
VTLSEHHRTRAEPAAEASLPVAGPHRRRAALAVIVVAVIAIALLALLVVPILAENQPRRSGTNSVFPGSPVAKLASGDFLCQAATVPRDTGAIEIPLEGGARAAGMRLELREAGKPGAVATAQAGAVRARATRFTLPRPLAADVIGTVCLRQGRGPTATLLGSTEKRGLEVNARIVPGAISMAYYRPGRERLISILPEVARRIGRTRGQLGGAWRGIAVIVLFGASVTLAGWLLTGLARDRARGRRIAAVVAVVAGSNALAWGLLTPTFQIPDEPYHVSYVQDFAEHGKPPRGPVDGFSPELYVIGGGAAAGDINFNPVGRGQWSPDAETRLDRALAKRPSTDNKAASVNVRDYPPAYYASLVPTYVLVHALGGSTLDALTFMRGIGVLLAMITALALLGLVRELFPDRPLLSGGVALVCAFQPVFTWISGGVNPDAALIALGAILFWLIARAHRRGLTTPVAAAMGLVVALCPLVKLAGLGLVPGAALAFALLLWRRAPEGRLRPTIAAAITAGVPALLYVFFTAVVWNRPIVPGAVDGAASAPSGAGGQGASGFASYLWQYVLPRTGSMTDFFHVGWTPKDFWTPLFVGKFGWFDYEFPARVNTLAFVIYAAIAVAALVALVPRLRRDAIVVASFATLSAGLLLAIARVGYPQRASGNFLFEQARYVLPLLGLYALALGLAFSLLRRRALVAVTSLAVALSALHLLGAFILTVRRYYL